MANYVNPEIINNKIGDDVNTVYDIMQKVEEYSEAWYKLNAAFDIMVNGIKDMSDIDRIMTHINDARNMLWVDTPLGMEYPYDTDLCVVQEHILKFVEIGEDEEDFLYTIRAIDCIWDEDIPF